MMYITWHTQLVFHFWGVVSVVHKSFQLYMIVEEEYCLTSLFGTNGHSSNIVIMLKTVQSIDEMNDVY